MKRILFIAALALGLNSITHAGVDLRITYNNQAVCRYEITVKAGGATIGKGVTDDNGEVSISGPDGIKDVDVYGYKKTANGEKKFDIQGYVKLDDKGFAHIKMEQLVKEMSSDSGFPETLMASAWGLTDLDCGVKANTSKTETKAQPAKTETKESSDDDDLDIGSDDADTDSEEGGITSQDPLVLQEQGLKNEIANLDRKIEKQGAEVKKLKAAAADERQIKIMELEVEEMKLKRERKAVALERNQKKQKGPLAPADAKTYDEREKSLESREDDIKASRKELEAQVKSEKKAAKMEQKGEQKAQEGERSAEERRAEAKLKVEIASLKTQISLKESALERARKKPDASKEEIVEKEAELKELKARLAELESGHPGEQ